MVSVYTIGEGGHWSPRLLELTESQLGRLEDEIRRERQRRASSAGGGVGRSPDP